MNQQLEAVAWFVRHEHHVNLTNPVDVKLWLQNISDAAIATYLRNCIELHKLSKGTYDKEAALPAHSKMCGSGLRRILDQQAPTDESHSLLPHASAAVRRKEPSVAGQARRVIPT